MNNGGREIPLGAQKTEKGVILNLIQDLHLKIFCFLLLASDTIFHIWAPLHRLASRSTYQYSFGQLNGANLPQI